MNNDDIKIQERFDRMFQDIFQCIADQRPFIDIVKVISEGLTPTTSASVEWPDAILEDVLDADVIGD